MNKSKLTMVIFSVSFVLSTAHGQAIGEFKTIVDKIATENSSSSAVTAAALNSDSDYYLKVYYDFSTMTSNGQDVQNLAAPGLMDLSSDFARTGYDYTKRSTDGGLDFADGPSVYSTNGGSTDLVDTCKTTDELTIEIVLKNAEDTIPELKQGAPRIFSMSDSSKNGNFYLGQNYNMRSEYQMAIKTDVADDDMDGRSIGTGDPTIQANKIQHIVITRDTNGIGSYYFSEFGSSILVPSKDSMDFVGDFDDWENLNLIIGNEASYYPIDRTMNNVEDSIPLEDQGPNVFATYHTGTKDWPGTIYKLAIYCKSLSSEQVIRNPNLVSWIPSIKPLDNTSTFVQSFDINRNSAHQLYKRLNGVNLPYFGEDSISGRDILGEMAQKIGDAYALPFSDSSGYKALWLEAADIATREKGFYNVTLKDFGKKMSNRAESVDIPFNDFSALIIGHTANDSTQDPYASEPRTIMNLLTTDSTFIAKAAVPVPRNEIEAIQKSNTHYTNLERLGVDLETNLVEKRQELYDGNGGVSVNSDASGLITTRAFLSEHAIAGTNRRLVEYSFQEFLCQPIDKWADNSLDDSLIAKDVDRAPGGEQTKFTNTCKSCHNVMDPLRTAFSHITFENGFVKSIDVMSSFLSNNGIAEDNPEVENRLEVFNGVVTKYNRNAIDPDGSTRVGTETINSYGFTNYATKKANGKYFEWDLSGAESNGSIKGNGIKDFGRMIASSNAFPKCMAKRVFRSVCKRDPLASEDDFIDKVVTDLQTNGNNMLRYLFKRVAISPECLGTGE